VRNELINEKGLSSDVADRVWSYVQMHGNRRDYSRAQYAHRSRSGHTDLIERLRHDARLSSSKSAVDALNDLALLFRYLTLFDVHDRVKRSARYPDDRSPIVF
jgi:hypothetical protein